MQVESISIFWLRECFLSGPQIRYVTPSTSSGQALRERSLRQAQCRSQRPKGLSYRVRDASSLGSFTPDALTGERSSHRPDVLWEHDRKKGFKKQSLRPR